MTDDERRRLLARVERIAGQVHGIARMIERDRDRLDVVTQVAAVRAALAKVATILIDEHVEASVTDAMSGTAAERRHKLDEIVELLSRYGRG